MREAGAGYRDIAEWMRDTQERKMTFMGVKCTPTCADAVRPSTWETTQLWAWVVWQKKGATFSRNPLISFEFLAPQPGLEPGTYGLTENQALKILI